MMAPQLGVGLVTTTVLFCPEDAVLLQSFQRPLEWPLSPGGNVIKKKTSPICGCAPPGNVFSLYPGASASIAQKFLMGSDMLYTNICIERYQFRHQFAIMVIQQNNNSRPIQSLWAPKPLALGQIYRTMHGSSLVELALNPTRKQLITHSIHTTLALLRLSCQTGPYCNSVFAAL